jgi:glycosyltransferase involved in cell wall biosynthesis
MSEVFFDLSELFLNSGVKFKYYGIARTVMEVAYELTKLDRGVRYVIYSPYHARFFEVFPRIGDASPTGVLDHNLPLSATPIRLRQSLFDNNPVKASVYWVIRKVVDFNLSGQILVSLGRPKIMSDYLTALEERGTKVTFVPLLHDMIPLHDFTHRNQFSFPKNFLHDNQVAIKASSLIFTNSEFTAREVLHFSEKGVLPPVSKVVAVPLCNELRPTSEPIEKRGPSGRYILCVGIYNGRKNLECVVEAMMSLHERGMDVPNLVLAGARRKRVEKFLKNKRFLPLSTKFHFVLNPNQAELAELYKSAFALVLPSRMEGWGLPISEALWCGTPALAADVPALREAGGDLARYFNPEKPDELADVLGELLGSQAEYEAMRLEIAKRKPSMRTWRDVASEILSGVKNTLLVT